MTKLYIHIIIFFCCCQLGVAQGSWTPNVSALDILEAGTDFSGTYESDNNEILVSPSRNGGTFANLFPWSWRIDVRRNAVNWDPSLTLSIRRTGNGTPFFFFIGGTVTGGTNYQAITTNNQAFFSGTNSRLTIPLQLKLENVSVLLPAKTYSTTIILTIVEN